MDNSRSWVLRGFQDRQKDAQQTDSPTSTRPGLRLLCQNAASNGWSIRHIDLKTAFLQGESYAQIAMLSVNFLQKQVNRGI